MRILTLATALVLVLAGCAGNGNGGGFFSGTYGSSYDPHEWPPLEANSVFPSQRMTH